MGERPVELGREHELRIHRPRFAAPQLAPLRLDVAVKRRIDLQHIDIARQVLHRMLRLLELRRIDDALPVLIRPSSRADVDPWLFSHLRRRLAQIGRAARADGHQYATMTIQYIPPGWLTLEAKQTPSE